MDCVYCLATSKSYATHVLANYMSRRIVSNAEQKGHHHKFHTDIGMKTNVTFLIEVECRCYRNVFITCGHVQCVH